MQRLTLKAVYDKQVESVYFTRPQPKYFPLVPRLQLLRS